MIQLEDFFFYYSKEWLDILFLNNSKNKHHRDGERNEA